jgi:hypothetical protein
LVHPGVASALAAALFGVGTPMAKQLLGTVDPWIAPNSTDLNHNI